MSTIHRPTPSHRETAGPPAGFRPGRPARAGRSPRGHGLAYLGGVDELFEAHDLSTPHHEVVGYADVDDLAGGLVGGRVPGQDDHVLAVDDVGVVMRGPAVPAGGELLHDVRRDARRGAV